MNSDERAQRIVEEGRRCQPRTCMVIGPTGPTGPTGPATITVGTTTTSDAGTSATVTNTGTNQNAVLNFTIPRGATGATARCNKSSIYFFKW